MSAKRTAKAPATSKKRAVAKTAAKAPSRKRAPATPAKAPNKAPGKAKAAAAKAVSGKKIAAAKASAAKGKPGASKSTASKTGSKTGSAHKAAAAKTPAKGATKTAAPAKTTARARPAASKRPPAKPAEKAPAKAVAAQAQQHSKTQAAMSQPSLSKSGDSSQIMVKDSPVKSVAPSKPNPGKPAASKPAAVKPLPLSEAIEEGDSDYAAGDYVVYPTHGVGRVTGIETQNISGFSLRLIAIKFEKDRMTLRVPVAKAQESGLRKLSTRKVMDSALAALKGKSRVKRTMWSRRAQEYEAKINSGDPVSIAEVVRDLHRGSDQPDQSYSERQMYQAALDRLAREFAAVEKIDEATAAERLEELLKAA